MQGPDLSLFLPDEEDTTRLARILAPHLRAGDVLLLHGSIGAGKTHFCRALIRARLGEDEEVPSPTFTLVQTYEGTPDIWHADLYRLSHPDEVAELGLEDAFATALCLVEWPDRLGQATPPGALHLRFAPEGEGRRVTLTLGARRDLAAQLAPHFATTPRAAAREALLTRHGWRQALRQPLAGDASARSYQRLIQQDQSLILMDSPPGIADDVAAFARIDAHLRALGLSAPKIMAQDLQNGFLLLEDLGDAVLARLLAQEPSRESALYAVAVDALVHLQSHPAPPGLPDLSAEGWAQAALLAVDPYASTILGHRPDPTPLQSALAQALHQHADGPRVLILRDYHAENLMWLPNRAGLARLGLLDFQLAQMGQPGYDLVSLLQDARRDVSAQTEAAMIARFAQATGQAPETFSAAYATLGAQRALRILGIFARLCVAEGKAHYLPLLPRVWGQLQRNLSHPALADLRAACAALPSPDALALEKLARCTPSP